MANKDLNATVALNAEALAELLQQVKQIQQGNGAAAVAAAPEIAGEPLAPQDEDELPAVLPPPAARRPPLPAARSWFRR